MTTMTPPPPRNPTPGMGDEVFTFPGRHLLQSGQSPDKPEKHMGKSRYGWGPKRDVFIAAWNAASSPEEVAQVTGMTREACCQRAATYRRQGTPLKTYRTRRTEADIAAFVAVWRAAHSLAEVAEQTGLTPVHCANLAASLRRSGTDLPMFTRGRANSTKDKASRTTFVATWKASTSLAEVALRTGLSRHAASARASLYRSQGENLPPFKGRKS